ncbi:MAG: hypothetical protein K2X82_26305 [Gemmataceae bacterium]|nr:hypothetical protein [Gemmataceae bacterium]
MAAKTLTTVLETVSATSVKLAAPARIGRGLVTADAYPADALSRQFPLPNPDSEPNPGDRQDDRAMHPHERVRAAVAVEPPAGRTGVHVPGSPARTRPGSFRHQPFTGWRRLTTPTRTSPRMTASLPSRLGSDCQSPERGDDVMAAKRGGRPAAAAGK